MRKSIFLKASLKAMLLPPLLASASAFIGYSSYAADDKLQEEVILPGKFSSSIRVRNESVDDASKTKNANGTTMRVRLGYETPKVGDFQGFVEGQANVDLGGEYNNTENGKTKYPVIADPNESNIHQAYLTYDGISDTKVKVGRQEILWDNQRFIGNVGWRQLGQSFDSTVVKNQSIKDLTIDVGYIANVKDIRNQDQSMSSPIVRVEYGGYSKGKLVLYGYFIDYDKAENYQKSSQTTGARFSGAQPITDKMKLLYAAEYAHQSEYGDNPVKYDADYVLGEVGVQVDKWTGKLGFENLGADKDANVGFSTPLATLHAFQGWADKFLVTPAGGVQDTYASLGTTALPFGLNATAAYHDFNSDVGSVDYGQEFDVSLTKSMTEGRLKGVVFVVKAAHYDAQDYSNDTNKVVFEFSKAL